MNYIALLRGINVGGNAKVEMKRLRDVFLRLGCSDVQTYINSGNVMFVDTRDKATITGMLESSIAVEFGLKIPVLLIDKRLINLLINKVPSHWTNDVFQRTDVMFLWPDIDNPTILEKITLDPKIENVLYIPGALVWNIARKDVIKGNGVKLIKSDLYKSMTVRNINTVRKINELANG